MKPVIVQGVYLRSGFWWIVKYTPDNRVLLTNKRNQSMIASMDRLKKLGIIKRRIRQ